MSTLHTKMMRAVLLCETAVSYVVNALRGLNIKKRFHIFSKDTTFHGFRELDESKTWWQRCLWLIILASSTIIFAVYASKQVDQFVNGRTAISIGKLNKGDYVFRPMQIMIPRWYFIDRSKLRLYNITYEEYSAAKSYLSKPYYSSNVPVEEAIRRLEARLKKLNVSSVIDLWYLLSFGTYDNGFGNNIADKDKLISGEFYGSCYYRLKTDFPPFDSISKNILPYMFDFDTYWKNVYGHLASGEYGPDEQNHITEADLKNPSYSPVLVLDGQQIVKLQSSYMYDVFIEARIQRRLVSCTNEFRTNPGYTVANCRATCEYQVDSTSPNPSPCINNPNLPNIKNFTRRLCSWGFLVNGSELQGEDVPFHIQLIPTEEEIEKRAKIGQCQKKCLPSCEQWKTTHSILATDLRGGDVVNNYTWIFMGFPEADSVLVTEEIYQYMWHDLVSDLGGLLGLWLGASMMSLFQVFDLCCRSLKVENQHINVPLKNIVVISSH